MKFIKYNSLENHYQQKFIDKVCEEGLAGGSWVATEKIHGANFSFWYNGTGDVKTAKRSGFCELNFFSCHIVFDKYQQCIKNMYEGLILDGTITREDTLVVYGEIFGGHFFGQSEPQAKQVQGGMNYHPNTEFMVFDIGIEKLDGTKFWVDYLTMIILVTDFHMLPTPLVGAGSLQYCLSLDNDFNSLVPKYYGLVVPDGEKAQCEGFVIRPIGGERFLRNGSRVIIKSKNSAFKEIDKASKQVVVSTMSEESSAVLNELSRYINRNRVMAVQSKEGEPNWKQVSLISGNLLKDAIEDFNKDNEKSLSEQLGDSSRAFNKFAMQLCLEEVRNYYKEIL